MAGIRIVPTVAGEMRKWVHEPLTHRTFFGRLSSSRRLASWRHFRTLSETHPYIASALFPETATRVAVLSAHARRNGDFELTRDIRFAADPDLDRRTFRWLSALLTTDIFAATTFLVKGTFAVHDVTENITSLMQRLANMDGERILSVFPGHMFDKPLIFATLAGLTAAVSYYRYLRRTFTPEGEGASY